MQENEKQNEMPEKPTNQNRYQNHGNNHWQRQNWSWMTPPILNQSQTSYIPNPNFQNSDYATHLLNLSYNLAHNHGYHYNPPNRWPPKQYRPAKNRLTQMNFKNQKNQPKFNKNKTKRTLLQKVTTSEKLKSIETSCKSSQKKSDISDSEKERLKKVEEDKQRIKMALTKKDGHTPLDFKSCIPALPNEDEIKETTTLKLSCSNNSKIVLSESDFREIGVMNDRNNDDFKEDSIDGYNSQLESEESSDDDCHIYSPEQKSNEDTLKEPKSIQIHSEDSLNESSLSGPPEKSNQQVAQLPSCDSKDLQERQSEAVAIESDANKDFNSENKSHQEKRKKSKKDEVVLGYIERDENLHCVNKVENRLKELNNYSKILSMYRNFMRYRHFAKNDSTLYDRLKLNRTENLENPLLNKEIVDRLKSSNVGGNAETPKVESLENRANVEEVDEFIAIFGDLLDENCTIPADALCRLGLGSLIFEGEENFDVSNDTDPILCENIKQEPVDFSDDLEEIPDEQQSNGSQENIHEPVITDHVAESEKNIEVDENYENRLRDSVPTYPEMKTQGASLLFPRDHFLIPSSNSLDRNVPDHCDDGSNSNPDNFTCKSLDGGNGFPQSLRSERESQPAFDSNEYNKSSSLEQMKVSHYMETKMKCASILDCEPFEVAKSVICSYGKDLLKLTNLTPVLETSFKNLLSMIRNLEQVGNLPEESSPSVKNFGNDFCEKRKYENSNNDEDCVHKFKRMKSSGLSMKQTFVSNETIAENTVDSYSKNGEVERITDVDLDSESESDDDDEHVVNGEKSSESLSGGANKSSYNFVDVNERIQSALAQSSSSNCPARIKTLKVYREDLFLGCCDGQVIRLTKNSSKLRLYRGHSDSVNCINGYRNLLLSGSSDGTVRVSYLLHPYISFHTFVLEEEVACFEVMWGKLFVGTLNGSVFRCNIKNFENCTVNKIMVGSQTCPILAIKASREGPRKIIIVSVRSKPLTIRDARNGLLLHTFDSIDVVYSFAHSTSSALVYCGTRNRSLVALDLVTGYERRKFHLGKSVVKVILRSDLLYTAAYNGTVHVYNLKEDKILYTNSTPRPIIDMEVWCNQMIIMMNNFGVVTQSLPST
ncbi:hypothetical protein LSTR_LSTR010797 [Laodelphax striatellus]|uniref:Uncharacterized protein n=1 Tax=Laodelphax striatellus TaxID=195883 RepID=A0A482X5H4_LAOST|nr:hypothetical protein LSTR_LSTR010797 [Laodelphax striatellus]